MDTSKRDRLVFEIAQVNASQTYTYNKVVFLFRQGIELFSARDHQVPRVFSLSRSLFFYNDVINMWTKVGVTRRLQYFAGCKHDFILQANKYTHGRPGENKTPIKRLKNAFNIICRLNISSFIRQTFRLLRCVLGMVF